MTADLEQNSEFEENEEGAGNSEEGAADATANVHINQEAVNAAINKQHEKFQNEARGHAKTKAELDAANAKLSELSTDFEPSVPDMPDSYDPEYTAKLAARDQAIIDKANWDNDESARADASRTKAKTDADAANATIQENAVKFRERAAKQGLNADDLFKAEQVVTAYGISSQVAGHILAQEQGPLIVQYLSKNVVELSELVALDPLTAAVKLSTEIVAKATKASGSGTPDPLDIVDGKGAAETNEYLKGVKFE